MTRPDHVLVTGGLGFIGSHVVDALVADGRRVRVLDSLHEAAHTGEPGYRNPGAEYVRADVGDLGAAIAALDGIDAVSHQAAMVGLGVDLEDIGDYVANNSLGTAIALKAMHRAGFTGRIVLAGSMVVYGEGGYRCREHGVVAAPPRSREALESGRFEPSCPHCAEELIAFPVGEDAPTDPRTVYAATKLHQEHLCAAFARESGATAIALRYHNVYGARMPRDTPYAGVASIFRSSLAAGRAPRVFEDGRQRRDFIHVADVARANLLALDAPAELGGAFNIATGRPRTVGEMAAALAAALGGPQPQVGGEFRLGDVRHVFASTERAREQLGFVARISLDDGIEDFATAPLRSASDPRVTEPGTSAR